VLIPGGVLRINGPDLIKIAKLYISGDYEEWRKHTTAPGETICDLMNDVFYNWGHQYIPDPIQLHYMLVKAKFNDTRICEINKSSMPELNNLEIRTMSVDTDSVLEAVK
jgi:predicted SAM-dependent methyltransferase